MVRKECMLIMMSLVRAQLGEPRGKSVIKPKTACLLAFCFVYNIFDFQNYSLLFMPFNLLYYR
nr:MAG TPA: hypothetical protein [Caudoviricetes sp.]